MTDTKTLEAVARAIDPEAWAAIEDGRDAMPESMWSLRRELACHKAQAAIDAHLKAISEAEAEARIPRTLKDCGYAPGSYMNKCRGACGKTHIADKRAWRCLECATAMLKAGETQ